MLYWFIMRGWCAAQLIPSKQSKPKPNMSPCLASRPRPFDILPPRLLVSRRSPAPSLLAASRAPPLGSCILSGGRPLACTRVPFLSVDTRRRPPTPVPAVFKRTSCAAPAGLYDIHPVPTDFDFQCLLPTVTKHKLTHNLGEGRGSQHE